MQVTVNYWAQIRQSTGVASESIELNGAISIAQLVTRLIDLHGAPLKDLLLDAGGELNKSILIIVNDNQLDRESELQLSDRDVVTFLSPLAGG